MNTNSSFIIVYRENPGDGQSAFNHMIGDEPGTTLCGRTTDGLEEREHPIGWAAHWCGNCMRIRWNVARVG